MKQVMSFSFILLLCTGFSMSGFSWDISYGGETLKAGERAWIDGNGQVMVALEDLQPEMIDSWALSFDGWQITIVAEGYGITSMISSPVLKRDGFAAEFPSAPVIKDQILYFPVESLAELMNCTVEKDSEAETLKINRPHTAASEEEAQAIRVRRMTSVSNNVVYPRPPIAQFEDILIPVPRGFVSARLYDPDPDDTSTRALYINIHGGGYTVGSIASSDHVCRDIANRSGQKVLSIEYGMLPEYPFPTGWEDAYTALVWTAKNAEALGIDPERITVGGDSAGATLATAAAMMARDRGTLNVAGQMLAYPVVDLTADWAGFVFDNPEDAKNPYATLLNGNLNDMPETLLLVAENDGLQPQGKAYADALKAAGVEVDFSVVPGTNHGFLATHADSRQRVADFVKSVGR